MFINNIFIFIATFLLFSCKTSTIYNESSGSDNKKILANACPADGSCFFEAIPNSTMTILKDDIGALYPQFFESDAIILKFEYKRDEQPHTHDGGYNELIYLEIRKDQLEIDLRNSELDKVKLLFGRLCYCKGSSGYYMITDGHLLIKERNKGKYHMELSFQTTEVPQIINRISETFTIK